MRACIRVSGTYFPPNLPNLPKVSGRVCKAGVPIVGSLVKVHTMEALVEGEGQDVNLRNREGELEWVLNGNGDAWVVLQLAAM